MLDVALRLGQVEKAVDHAALMLKPSQQRLPDSLTAALDKAQAAWQADEAETAAALLQEVLQLAQTLNYL
jgi:hypothetical protein